MTDAIIPSIQELTRSTELPAQDQQTHEQAVATQQVIDLTLMPGWRVIEEVFESHIQIYDRPKFDASMQLEEIGKQALFSQTIAEKLKEIRDDIRARAKG